MRIRSSGSWRAALLFALVSILLVTRVHAQGDLAGDVLNRINAARTAAGLAPLARNAQLESAAQGHALDLAAHGSHLGHVGSDGSTMRLRIARAGYPFGRVGENWASHRSLDRIMDFWLTDPPHRRNVLNPAYKEIGIGVALRPGGTAVVVTDFGGPGAAPLPVAALQQSAPAAANPPAPKPIVRASAAQKPTAAPAPQPADEPAALTIAADARAEPPGAVKASGKFAKLEFLAQAESTFHFSALYGDPVRMSIGGTTAAASVLVFGLAVLAHRRRSR
jgi:hypothetical protein